MISKETVRKMLEKRACDGVECAICPIDAMQFVEGERLWIRCCKKNNNGDCTAAGGRKFRPRVIRLLTEWLAEQEKEDSSK